LAEVDRAHERLSGPATRHILEREHVRFGKAEYARLAHISIGHLYNLRASAGYRQRIAVYESTRPTAVSIGDRRRPEPQGRPGYLRVDTVHQGDWDGAKGVYHINAVDAVTQCEPSVAERAARCIDALEMGITGGNFLPVVESVQTMDHGQAMIYGLRRGLGLLVQLMPDVVQQRGFGDRGKGLGASLKPTREVQKVVGVGP
jgi:hypothetical protein